MRGGRWQIRSGYTLIEILVAITIVGILFGFGYVSYRDFGRRQALAGIAKQVQGDLRLAQQMALSGEKPKDDSVCRSTTTLYGYRFGVPSTKTYRLRAECSAGAASTYREITVPDDIDLAMSVSSGSSINPVIFKVLGNGTNIPEGVNVFITLTQVSTGRTAVITVTPAGEIK